METPQVPQSDLHDTELIAARVAADTGHRTDLDDVITAFGYSRAELADELDGKHNDV